jgi:hypothetical protein
MDVPSREIESVPWSSASTDPDENVSFHSNPHQILTKNLWCPTSEDWHHTFIRTFGMNR